MEVFKRRYRKKTLTLSALGLLVCGSLAYGQIQAVDTFVIETLHVFPDTIETNSWSNVETIVNQNLSDDALYQDFNTLNSVYLKESAEPGKVWRIDNSVDVPVPDAIVADEGATTTATTTETDTSEVEADDVVESNGDDTDEPVAPTVASSTDPEDVATTTTPVEESVVDTATTTTATTSDETVPEVSTESVATTSETVSESDTAASTTPVVEDVELETSTASSATTTAFRTLRRGFALVFETFTERLPFAQNSTTTENEQQSEVVREELVEAVVDESEEETVAVEEGQDDESAFGFATAESEPPAVIETEPAVESVVESATSTTVVETSEPAVATTTDGVLETASSSATTTPVASSTDAVTAVTEADEDQTSPDEIVEDETITSDTFISSSTADRYFITLSGFGLPIFSEEQLRLDGGQLRVSMAAKKRTFRLDESARFIMEYSFDDGATWEASGEVVIEDEISNSINGGYYLFGLPTLEDPAVLETLAVRLVYEGERSALQEFYIDSAWLELFTVTQQSSEEDFLASFDDNFQTEMLSGDTLVLPNGETIEFDFTDNNDQETLIIKSDDVTYQGLSEATSYISVTNTSDQPDTFELKAYFPNNVGAVTDVRMFEQNKPRQVVIPEYRPYVYYCEAGWELVPPFADTEEVATASTSSVATTTTSTTTEAVAATSSPVLIEAAEYRCAATARVHACDALDGDNTQCMVEGVQVDAHELTQYAPGWITKTVTTEVTETNTSRLARLGGLLGFAPITKEIPNTFEPRVTLEEGIRIQPGETKYFEMQFTFPPESSGEFWIEAVGEREYGLLDPFWSSQWTYRLPITIDNTAGATTLTEHQVYLEFDNTLTDFWSNVASDGADIRFVQQTILGNEEDWYGTGWETRTPITIQASEVDDDLTDFPVYVDLADLGSGFFNNVQSDGADIRVTTGDGTTELAYDLVGIDTGADTGELHFKANSISSSTDTTFYIYYDNPNVGGYSSTDTFGSEAVWSSDFIAVYHFEEDASGTGNADLYQDSTSNGYDADDEVASTGKTGKLGLGQEIRARESVLDDYILYPSDTINGENVFTASFWYNTTQTGDQALLNAGDDNEYLAFLRNTTLLLYDGGGTNDSFTLDTDVTGTGWKYFTIVRDANNNQWRLFVDGVADNQNPLSEAMTALAVPDDCFMTGLEQDTTCLNSGASNQHVDGFMDEVRFLNDIPTDAEISASFRNQATTTDFYTVGTANSFTITMFSELDHWVQYFDNDTDEARIWVQVDSIAASASTTIELYYGNASAVSTSDEYAPFTYSTVQDLYYVTSDLQSNPIVVYSLIDNNEVSIDGSSTTTINSGEQATFAVYSSSSVISALGPITARTTDQSSEPPAPIAFATTTFIAPTNRGDEDFYVHAPFNTASVSVFDGGAGIATDSGTVPAGGTAQFNVNVGGANYGVVDSTEPVVVFQERDTGDSYVAYPPTRRDLFGFYSTDYQYGTTQSGSSSVKVYCSGGSQGTTTAMDRGDAFADDYCATGPDGTGDLVMLTEQTAPIAAVQEADGDGGESTIFLPVPEFGTRYILPQAAEYVSIGCTYELGTTTIEVQTSAGTLLESGTCTPSSTSPYPGALNITPTTAFAQGSQVVSTNNVPFYMYYEDNGTDDETNTWSAVQARQFESLDVIPYSFGAQEMNIDAEYEQYSFTWYENNDTLTPTSTWSLGDDGNVAEGDAITGSGAVDTTDVLRLRMSLLANVATGTASSTAFVLQYAEATTCSTASGWADVGEVGSTTAAFTGYNIAGLDDGVVVPTTLLTSSTIQGTFEEANLSEFVQNDIPPGDVAEWDWVLSGVNANTNAAYCFRMIRSNGDELATYTVYPQLETSGPPDAGVLIKPFDNEHEDTLRPTFQFTASDLSGDDLHYQIQVDDDVAFGSPVYDQNSETNFINFSNTVVPSDKSPFNSGQTIEWLLPSDLTSSSTYWWRVRAIDPDGSNTYGDWSTAYSFTINESLEVSEWFQTTDEQFETNSLTSATTTGSDSVEPDLGGSSLIGEYGSVDVNVGATTTVNLTNTFTDPVVVTSVRYARSVTNGEQPATRVLSKSASSFDVIAYTYDFTSVGTATIDYIVMEAGEYLMEDGGSGMRVFATSTSVSAVDGSNIATDPGGLDITFPTTFSAPPIVMAAVTSNNDPDWLVATVYDGNNIDNPPTAAQVSLYFNDSLASDGHTSAEDMDIIAFEPGSGTNDSVAFATQSTDTDVTHVPVQEPFATTYSSAPGTILVQQRTMFGAQGGYAMVDIDTLPTATDVTIAFEEGGTNGGRDHTTESIAIVSFESGSGDILRAGNGVVVSTGIDFDDADIGNAWGEVSFTDAGDVTYQVEYQTGSGFATIPDTDLPGNSAGFTTSPINILSLDTDTYNELRLSATLSGVNPEIFDWTVTWGQRVDIPTLGDPFDNQQVATTTPTFDFVTTDPQGDDLVYEISWSTDNTFTTSSTTRASDVSSDFSAGSPYTSGDTVTFTISSGDALTNGTTYWWRVRAKDPSGGDAFSPWSEPDSFTVDTATVVSTWFQTTEEQFLEGELDGVTASTSDSVEISTEIGEYGTTTITNNNWLTINTQLTYNNMVVVGSSLYPYPGNEDARTVQVRNKTNNSFEIRVNDYSNTLTAVTDVHYVVMEAGDWSVVDGSTGTRFIAGTAPSVANVEGSVPGYTGGTQIDFSPDFGTAPGVLAAISSANGSKWVSTVVDDGSQTGEVGTGDMYLALGIGRDTDTVRTAEDIDYIAFETGTGSNNGVLFDAFNTGNVVTESETESTISFNQSFTSAPGVIVVHNNANNGGDGAFALVDLDTTVTNTEVDLVTAEVQPSDYNHASEVVSLLAFESESGTIRRESITSSGLIGTFASEPVLFTDGTGPKFQQALFGVTAPGNSSTSIQVQYQAIDNSWSLIPDTQIPGNSVGTTTSPLDLTNVDVSTYQTIRLFATLQCDTSNCPTLDDWSVEWSEGVPISGTISEYDRTTAVTSGTVRVAVNSIPGSTGTINGDGTWTINNVTAFDGDTVTVWVDSATSDDEKAVGVFVYDGIGDMINIELFEQHLSLSADENGTTTNANLAAYDNSVSGNANIFFDVDSNNDLSVCAIAGCDTANLYIGPGDIYTPDPTDSGNVAMHDFVNDGIFVSDSNTLRVSGSWDNNAASVITGSTVIFTATSTTETITDNDNLLEFTNVTFGETSGAAIWQAEDPYDIDGDLTVAYGTFDRSSSTITVSGNLTTGANGLWAGIATTTFDGTGTSQWTDGTSGQNLGYVIIDGTPKTVLLQSDVLASTVTIADTDTLNAGGSNTLSLLGDFTNENSFLPQTSTIAIIGTSTTATIMTGGSSLYNLTASTTGGSVSFTESNVTMLGDLTIATGTVTLASATTSIGGSFTNSAGNFAHNNAEVRFTSSNSETVTLLGTPFLNSFYDVSFTGSGDWTFLDASATTTNTVVISNGDVTFPSTRLTVGRDFTTSGSGTFDAAGGEVLFLIRSDDLITTNGSVFNDVRFAEGTPVRDGDFDEAWLYRAMITINASQVDDDLTDFPVYLDLADFGSDFFTRINSDGGDIRITQSDGVTEVPREIVSASTTAETGEVYFKAPSLSSTTNAVFYLYYGNNAAVDYSISDTNGAENVWDDDFLAVYHMEEFDPVDSTSFDRDTASVGDTPALATGLFGQAISLTDNGGSDYLDLQSNLSELNGLSEMTVSAWANVSDDSNDDSIFTRGPAGTAELIWDNIGGTTNNDTWTFNVDNTGSSANRVDAAPTGISVGDTWQYVVGAMESDNRYIYVDGTLRNTNSGGATTLRTNTSGSYIGYWVGSTNFDYDGLIDEYRISRVERQAAWVAAEYRNMATSTDFYTVMTSSGSSTRIMASTNVVTDGDVIIESGQVQFPDGVLSVGGSFDNDGVFVAGSGEVSFIATSTSETIAAGTSNFYDLSINGDGQFTVTENATATNAITLTDADTFTVDTGIDLTSAGTFTNSLDNASTTWTGATLALVGGSDFSLNDKTNDGDDYNILTITGDGDIGMWNSTASTYDLQDTASLYSQDHANADGDLYIFGDYVRETGTEHWSYATDFDGVDLSGGSERLVNVRVASGAQVVASSSVLSILGTSTASTTVDAQSGTFTLIAQNADVAAEYFTMTGTDADGLQLISSTTITTFADALFTIGAGVSSVTVDASTIDTNPATQFFDVDFTSGGGSANVTLSGSPASFWWFRDGEGDRYGEDFDNADGNPGSIRWDDSAYTITISGVVYEADGTTTMGGPTCNGSTPNVRVVVDGGAFATSTACDGADGSYTLTNVAYVGDPTLVVYLDTNGGETGSVVTKTPTANITDLDIYADYVITRHEDVLPLTIADMAVFDEAGDADIRFAAATSTTDTLTVRGESGLYVFGTTTFTPDGTVTLESGGSGAVADGTLQIGPAATFTGATTTLYQVGGSIILNASSTLVTASSTFELTATSSGKTITGPDTITFNDLTFSGSGAWNLNTDITALGDIAVNAGVVTGTGDITLPTGSFSGNGLVSLGGGLTTIIETNTYGGTQGWTFNDLTLGDGGVVGVTTPGSLATTTIGGILTISAAHTLDAGAAVFDLTGAGTVFIENGNFSEDTSTVRYSGSGIAITRTAYYNLVVDADAGSVSATAPVTGLQVLNDLMVGQISTATLDINAQDPLVAVGGDVTIGANGTIAASDTNTFQAFGSWDNDGTFTANGGLVTFNAATGTQTIAAGTSDFADLSIIGGGTFVVTESATATDDMIIAGPSGYTISPGVTLAVGGTFTNDGDGSGSVWTDSTLYLYGGQAYTINDSADAEDYATIIVDADTQPRVWNASFATTTVLPDGSLYSMDHEGTDGDLYIFGDYVNNGFTDYWSYDTDWDGVDLGVATRTAAVYVEGGGSIRYEAGVLAVLGTTSATTTIQNQGSGTYDFVIGGSASTSWQYAAPRDLSSNGLVLAGTPTIDTFDFVDWLVQINSAQAITVGGTVINQNPAKNLISHSFNDDVGVTGAINVTATGSSVSSWRFANHVGDIDGETFDNDSGNPGEITWIDSANLITVGGNVYSDESNTVSSVCGATQNITLAVAGLLVASTSCNAGTGAYSFANVAFGTTDSLIVFIDGETEQGATVTEDPRTNILNMDVIENRVIVRHEDTDPLNIVDMAVYDSSNDPDIPFTAIDAGTDTLTLPADTKLIVWDSKTFTPNGNVTISGGGAGASFDGALEVYDNAIFEAQGSETHSVGGSMELGSGASFVSASSTFTFTTPDAGRVITVNDNAFHHVTFSGTGDITITDGTFTAFGDVAITATDLTLPTGTTTLAGDFSNSGGSFTANTGTLLFTATDAGNTVTWGGSIADTVRFAGSGGSWTMTDTNATTTASFTVASGTVTLPSGQLAVGTDFVVTDAIAHNGGAVVLTAATGSRTVTLSGNDLTDLTVADGASFTMTDADVTLLGDLMVASGTLNAATNTMSIGGSLDAIGGVVDFASSTVIFNSVTSGETVDPGANPFYNVSVASVLGGWTFSSATATNAFALTSADTFTLGSGETLTVGGVFTNAVGGVRTTWTGSTLSLQSGMDFSVNTKSIGGDAYETVLVAADSDLRFWDSSFGATTLGASSSVYSQDHAGVSGDLTIIGEFVIGTTTEYWSYATDFDGTSLGGSSRAVNVVLATTSSSSITMESGGLEMIGISTATTTIASADSTLFAFAVTGGTLNADYYQLRNLDANGLDISGVPTITSLGNGDFEQALNTANMITLKSTALDANASLVIPGVRFEDGGFTGGVNVSLDATTTNSWTFTGHVGNLSGEVYDVDGFDGCSSIRWDDSSCLLTEQTHYRWRNDDGGEGAPDSEWFDTNWDNRQRVRIINSDAGAYTNAAVKLDVTYTAGMNALFDDLRFTDSDGTTEIDYWIERFTSGVSADVWVEVPFLPADTVSEIFMYYNNVSATTTGSSTAVFVAADDFEAGALDSAYSEDTSLFTVDGSFAFGGSFGLDTTGNEGLRADTGITRFDQTVSQGEIIRYMQYIDTTTGASDESCTMFGVQSPGSLHDNYAVCLELFGTDRMSLVRDVESTDTFGSVVVLASTTVTYATGWYEVEVDWQSDDTIDVALYTEAGSLVATTSATDGTYENGGYGFTYWGFNGGWDSFTSRPRTETAPSVFFGAEQSDGGATWAAAEDAVGSGFELNETARLRMSIENTGLPIVDQEFRLEYAPKLTAPSCEAVPSVNFGAVPVAGSCGTDAVCMTATTSITNGAATTDHLLGEIAFTPGQTVTNLANQTSAFTVLQNEYTEVEYAFQLTSFANNDAYCFRVTDAGTALDSYATIAELSLEFAPTLGAVTLNDGNDIVLSPGATTTVVASTTITDLNGFADVTAATTTFYKTSAGALCTPDDNDCYVATSSCSFTACSGNSCNLTCTADFAYHTDPTDSDGGEEWFAFVEIEDSTALGDFGTAPAVELLTLRALGVDDAIAYGTLDVNSDTGTNNASTTLTNLGNESIDVQVAGTDMTDGSISVIEVENQKFATSTFDYTTCTTCSLLDEVAATVEVDLNKPIVSTPATEDFLYWGIFVPFGINSAPHSGINTFTATGD